MNREYAEPGRELSDGDEVALIPPVSGGSFRLTEGPVNLTAVVVAVVDERAGAIATFLGTVRAQSRGRDVIALEYEAYEEMAEDVMAQIAAEMDERYDLCKVAITHRLGRVEVGETSVAIAVSAPHRQDALAACKDVIEALKARVPSGRRSSTRAARSGSAAARRAEARGPLRLFRTRGLVSHAETASTSDGWSESAPDGCRWCPPERQRCVQLRQMKVPAAASWTGQLRLKYLLRGPGASHPMIPSGSLQS